MSQRISAAIISPQLPIAFMFLLFLNSANGEVGGNAGDSLLKCSSLHLNFLNSNLTVLAQLQGYSPVSKARRISEIDPEMADQLEEWLLQHPIVSPRLGASFRYKKNPSMGKTLAPAVALRLKALKLGIDKDSIKNIFADLGNGTFLMAVAIKSKSVGAWYVFDPTLGGRRDSLQSWYEGLLKVKGVDPKNVTVSFTDGGRNLDGKKMTKDLLYGPELIDYIVDVLAHIQNEKIIEDRNESVLTTLTTIPVDQDSHPASDSETYNLFSWISEHPLMSYKHQNSVVRNNFCHLRSMAVQFKALQMGIEPENIKKIWVFGSFSTDPESENNWGYHVATAIRKHNGKWLIHDPYFEKPMSPREWYDRMKKTDPFNLAQLIITDANVMTPFLQRKTTIQDLAGPRLGFLSEDVVNAFLFHFFLENSLATGQYASSTLIRSVPRLERVLSDLEPILRYRRK